MNNRKRYNIIQNTVCLFPFLFILVMFILHLSMPDKTFSKEEKRYLAQWPSFSIEEALNGSYGNKVESYFSDQFPLRNFWIQIQERTSLTQFGPNASCRAIW